MGAVRLGIQMLKLATMIEQYLRVFIEFIEFAADNVGYVTLNSFIKPIFFFVFLSMLC